MGATRLMKGLTAGALVGDSTTTLIGQNGKTPSAPWVPYTRGL
jgi:hypothetical protein